jgi:hypothetical protein
MVLDLAFVPVRVRVREKTSEEIGLGREANALDKAAVRIPRTLESAIRSGSKGGQIELGDTFKNPKFRKGKRQR